MSNPFAAPEAPVLARSAEVSETTTGPWRDGDVIVHTRTSEEPWPSRCCRCNKPTDAMPIKIPLQWVPRWVYFLALIGPIFVIIGMLATRWQGVAMVRLCEEHAQRRFYANVGLGVSGAAMLGGLLVGLFTESLALLLIGFLALIPLIVFALLVRTVYPEVMDEDWARLKGGDPDFVASLPEWKPYG